MYNLIPPSCRLVVARYVQVAHACDMTKLMSHVAQACQHAKLRSSGLPGSQPNLIKLYMTCTFDDPDNIMYV